jgi:hypothetical protein
VASLLLGAASLSADNKKSTQQCGGMLLGPVDTEGVEPPPLMTPLPPAAPGEGAWAGLGDEAWVSHRVSAVVAQAISTPAAHVVFAEQLLHGA